MTHEKTAIPTRTQPQKHTHFSSKNTLKTGRKKGTLTHALIPDRPITTNQFRHVDLPQPFTVNTVLTRPDPVDAPPGKRFPTPISASSRLSSLSAAKRPDISGRFTLPYTYASTGMVLDTIFFTLQNEAI